MPPAPLGFGVAVPSGATNLAEVDEFEFNAGRQVDRVMWYEPWSDNQAPATAEFDAVLARGAIPILTWEPWDPAGGVTQPTYTLASITAGNHDTYINSWADALATWGGEIHIRFAHEMNGDWYPWGHGVNGNTAGEYAAAYRYVVDRFRARGASNVVWLWSPNVTWTGGPALNQFYPGDSYSDRVSIDGYNWGTVNGQTWKTPAQVFDATITEISGITTKPQVIGETGCAEQGGDKAAWIADFFTWLPSSGLQAFTWFEYNKEADWRIVSTPTAAHQFNLGVSGTSDGLTQSDTFEGTAGTAWSATWQATQGSTGASATLNGTGKGVLTLGTVGGYGDNVRKHLASTPQTGLRRYRTVVTINDNAEQYIRLFVNASADISNGYFIELGPWSTNEEVRLWERTAWTTTKRAFAPLGVGAGNSYEVLVEWDDSMIRAKVWNETSAMPSTWTVEYASTTHTTGDVVLELSGGNAATAVTAGFDNFALYEPSDGFVFSLSAGGSSTSAGSASATSGSSWTTFDTTLSTEVVLTGLENGKTYEFRVAAVTDAGQGEWSTVVSATPNQSSITASGSSGTAGSAAVTAAVVVSASGGSVSAGAATVTATRPVTGSGASGSSGDASTTASHVAAAAGSTVTSGAATVTSTLVVSASAASASTGDAAITAAPVVSASGVSSSAGTATIAGTFLAAASGAAATSGSAAVTLDAAQQLPVASTGVSATAGTAATTATGRVSASAASTTAGSAAATRTTTITAAAATSTAGSATAGHTVAGSFPISSVGTAATAGSAETTAEFQPQAAGSTATTGSAAVTATSGVTASASTGTAGTANVGIEAAPVHEITGTGSTATTGTAAVVSTQPVTGQGASNTAGSATVEHQLAPSHPVTSTGSTGSGGFASVTQLHALTVDGQSVTVGVASTVLLAQIAAGSFTGTAGQADVLLVVAGGITQHTRGVTTLVSELSGASALTPTTAGVSALQAHISGTSSLDRERSASSEIEPVATGETAWQT